MHRIKKILYSLLITIGFALCFIFGKDKINILAMGNFNNSIGTIPIQMDIDNYDTKNIIFPTNIDNACGLTLTYDITEQIFTLNGLSSSNNCDLYIKIFEPNQLKFVTLNYYYISGTGYNDAGNDGLNNYTIAFFIHNDNYSSNLTLVRNNNQMNINGFSQKNNFNTNDNYKLSLHMGFNSAGNVHFENFKFKLMITNNENYYLSNIDSDFSPPFVFGYNASLSYVINTTSNTTVNYYFNDNTYTKTTSIVNSGYLIENYYIPFNIDSKGYISFPSIYFGISSISNSSSNNTYSLYLELTPVFNAYYKGEYTTNIYTKLNYMSNDLFFSGITFSGCKNTSCTNNINSGNLSLTNPKTLAVTETNDTGNISTTNISTYYNDDIKNRNYFEYNNYLNVGFRIGDLAMNYNYMNGRNYLFGISSLASRIIDNQTTSTPLPDNELTNDKYNTCSAWYDIPCQLGNAITYVIYEAPIISPIINFFDGFIDLIQSLVTYITWFEGLGLIFGVFIVIFFIRMIILLVKGGNDD